MSPWDLTEPVQIEAISHYKDLRTFQPDFTPQPPPYFVTFIQLYA